MFCIVLDANKKTIAVENVITAIYLFNKKCEISKQSEFEIYF